ncbi:D-hexose-6-phosphate mutarotase [Sanguibacter massiliensis]|uniref:D-hexose-6-phosphate mutarotase n=1 Tax=Sanguibacter massiliensis TaxID=1973217 RepID=UPI0013E9CFEA|nr:D-hexose-6-phosphate mutarotase [Sanguibacter massiliensis]
MPVTLPSTVRLEPGVGDAPLVVVEHRAATARVHAYGAHVVAWAPAGARDALWLSPDAVLAPGAAIRGGIPLCFPWFGPHPDGAGPAHGFARTSAWRLVGATELPDDEQRPGGAVLLTFELTPADVDPALAALWPHDFTARTEVEVGASLTVSLTTTNHGGEPADLTQALHTYLAVDDVRRARVDGLDGGPYLDKVDGDARQVQDGPVLFTGPTDRVYQGTSARLTVSEPGGRTLEVAKAGSRTTVVWNPWVEGASGMRDVPDDAWPHFVCVEAANAADDAVRLPAGETQTLTTRLTVL